MLASVMALFLLEISGKFANYMLVDGQRVCGISLVWTGELSTSGDYEVGRTHESMEYPPAGFGQWVMVHNRYGQKQHDFLAGMHIEA
jgi:hypothetical protein